MNLAPERSRRTVMTGARRRMLGVTVGLLVAVPLGAATSGGPAGTPISTPAATDEALVAAVVPPLPRSAERMPARHDGAIIAPEGPGPSVMPRSTPTWVRIPAIGVDSDLVGLGLQHDGRMEVPAGAFPAGWYTGAPTPGELGPAILAGHVDHSGQAGVFHRLRDVRPGDVVEVTREDGSVAVFHVTRVEQHPKDAFPTAAVYGDIDHAGLRLITCGGSFDRRVRSYEDNIVVFAELAAVAAPDGAGGRRS